MAMTLVIVILLQFLTKCMSQSNTILDHSIHTTLVSPWDIRLTTPDHIHYCLLMSGVTHSAEPTGHFLSKLARLLESILLLSRGTPLHLIFLTEHISMDTIKITVETAYSKAVMDRLLKREEQHKKNIYKIPRVEVEFVKHKDITDKFEESIAAMKKHFNNWDRQYSVKGKFG